MSIFGHFKIKVHTPNGEVESDLQLEDHGGHITGVLKTADEESPVEHGELHGHDFSFTSELHHPAPMTAEFHGHCADDHCEVISGKVHAGSFGDFDFEGHKV